MSGGHFDYEQYKIGRIADEVEQLIIINGKKRQYKEEWQDEYHYEYSPEIIEKFKEGLMLLKKAEIYAQRIDWLVSGDDSEESFFSRLKKELEELK